MKHVYKVLEELGGSNKDDDELRGSKYSIKQALCSELFQLCMDLTQHIQNGKSGNDRIRIMVPL